jgi:hypothetical protein
MEEADRLVSDIDPTEARNYTEKAKLNSLV